MKVMTIVGTRPEVIRLSRVIAMLDAHTEHVLVHTGQNYAYELNQIFFDELGIRKPDHFLDVAGSDVGETIGRIIERAYAVMRAEQPRALLILGDTNSCLAAIAAKRLKVPVFHMEAGNRSFDERVPEEINRRIVDHISDINMPYAEHGRRHLLAEGIRAETVLKTGSPMHEVLAHHAAAIDASQALARISLTPRQYFLVSAHREDNVDDPELLADLMRSLEALHAKYAIPVIMSTHPRTRKRLESSGVDLQRDDIRFLPPMGFFDYVKLQMHARCVLSDSGTITEESSILNFPAVTIRQSHERPEGMDEGALIMCGTQPDRVLEAVAVVIAQHREGCRDFDMVADYAPTNVSAKVLRIILSYVDYIDRVVWRKPRCI